MFKYFIKTYIFFEWKTQITTMIFQKQKKNLRLSSHHTPKSYKNPPHPSSDNRVYRQLYSFCRCCFRLHPTHTITTSELKPLASSRGCAATTGRQSRFNGGEKPGNPQSTEEFPVTSSRTNVNTKNPTISNIMNTDRWRDGKSESVDCVVKETQFDGIVVQRERERGGFVGTLV